ncbi:MAG: hypothetical protein V4618_04955 [Pseudomonadota bacterium]
MLIDLAAIAIPGGTSLFSALLVDRFGSPSQAAAQAAQAGKSISAMG